MIWTINSQSFAPDVKNVVKNSSNNRMDITDILKKWQNTDYEKLLRLLKARGITLVKLIPKETEIKSQNSLVISITFNNKEFVSGDEL